MEKMTMKQAAELRNALYAQIIDAVGEQTEPVVDGLLVHLLDGNFAEVKVVIKNEKFDLEVARQAYADKMARAAERIAKQAEAAAKKAEAAAKKTAKVEE